MASSSVSTTFLLGVFLLLCSKDQVSAVRDSGVKLMTSDSLKKDDVAPQSLLEGSGRVTIEIDSREFPEIRDLSLLVSEACTVGTGCGGARWIQLTERCLEARSSLCTERTIDGKRQVARFKLGVHSKPPLTKYVLNEVLSLPVTLHRFQDPTSNGMIRRTLYNTQSSSYDFVIHEAGDYTLRKDGE